MTTSSPAVFVAGGLQTHNEVSDVQVIAADLIQVRRKKYDSFIVGVVSTSLVTPETIGTLVSDSRVDFIANIPKEAIWTGEAIDIAQTEGLGWGGIKDLFSAAASPSARGFVRKEYGFAERIFSQHTAVKSYERVMDRVYKLNRGGRPPVTVVLVNEYDMTADHVRTAWERYGPFTDILANDPNCRFSPESEQAAKDLNVIMLPLREFMGRLNSR